MPDSTAALRVLIAERHPSVAAELTAALRDLGYEVAGVAAALGEAIRLAETTDPHIALIDAALAESVSISRADGQAFPHDRIPVLYTVAEDDAARLRHVRRTHPGGYLLKPFDERELRSALAASLEDRRASGFSRLSDEGFFDIAIDMLCCLGFDGYFARLNPAWERVLGFTRDELMSRPFIEFVHPDDRERTLRQNRAVRAGGFAHSFENRYLCKDGSYRWLLWNAAPDVARSTIYSVARDVTERKEAEAALERLSTTDELTGLWNRRGFFARAERDLKRRGGGSAHVLLFYMDLDRFKEINDTHGHLEGDRVLVDVARLLQESCRGSDVVARIGGDEFVLMALDEHGGGEHVITQRILDGLGRLNAANRHPYAVALTIGAVHLRPGEEAELTGLLARADRRMYRRKREKASRS